MHRTRILWVLTGLTAAILLLAACAAPTQAPTSAPDPIPTCPATEAAAPCPTAVPPVVDNVPFETLWAASPHNDKEAMAFNDWNDTDDKSVPIACATCHSSTGYQDFMGADGSEAGKVDKAVPVGETIQCVACHNDRAIALTSVTFPSGITIDNLGDEARCMVCHQGRAAKKTIDDKIAQFKIEDLDKVVAPLKDGDKVTNFSFINIHYFAAAATLYGGQVQGGYQYDGKTYDYKNQHTEGYATCVGCHNPHTTEVKVDSCALCHEGVKTAEDLKNIRIVSSAHDYNGNGNVEEGIAEEIAGMQQTLLGAIQSYATDIAGTGILYDAATYPYFMVDKDGDGKADVDDKGAVIAYNTWTARLLKAAYNYQVSIKDPGAFAHNPKYIIELLYDSTEDLNTKLATPVDMSKLARSDAARFAGDTMPFRDWDAEGEVPAGCAKCHSATGLPEFIANGGKMLITRSGGLEMTGIVAQPVANGYLCSTCHNEASWPARYAVTAVPFPNGASMTFSTEKDENGNLIPVDANLCIECHQGRQSTVTMNNYLSSFNEADTADAKITFKNVHYFAAGATLFGSAAQGIYQYDGKEYNGQFMHDGNLNKCTDCHDAHVQNVKTELCSGCHQVDDPKLIRMMSTDDYDGDGDTTEGLSGELTTYQEKLFAAIQDYATKKAGAAILYDAEAYPYFFLDNDADGKADVNDKGAAIGYNSWTPRLLKAAYNYQYSIKDPGAFAHNFKYVVQALYDSIQDLGGSTTGMIRPE
jgi:hypothetical protein